IAQRPRESFPAYVFGLIGGAEMNTFDEHVRRYEKVSFRSAWPDDRAIVADTYDEFLTIYRKPLSEALNEIELTHSRRQGPPAVPRRKPGRAYRVRERPRLQIRAAARAWLS